MNHKLTSLIDNTLDHITSMKIKNLVILASPSTIKSGLYEKSLQKAGLNVIVPTKPQQNMLEELITDVIANKPLTKLSFKLVELMASFKDAHILLGCTELSLLHGDVSSASVIDPMNLIVDKVLS
ncbi:MAG: aspartate/glutamate racemase family protein [Candidatus Saccharimonadales bacterium]